ncbi:zinc ribbon domain-containing protein [Streptomyces sp. NPDC004393]
MSERRSNLNDALAWSAARWAVDQAIAARATVIYLEDLRSMEAGGMGRTHNSRMSQTVRGQITDRIRHLAAEVGIAVVTVPARNTSKHCPHCLTPLRHRKAPDRPAVSGWKWAICPNPECGWQGDRDQGAWQRIAARGLTHQTKTIVDRSTGQMVIRAVVDTMEAKAVLTAVPKASRTDRSKTGPTRPRTNRLTPRRREVPSPARPTGPAGQRPEGHAPPGRTRLPRAAHRHQGVTTISTPTTRRHRPRGATLGAGFHLHAHASPPRWAEPVSDLTVRTGTLS